LTIGNATNPIQNKLIIELTGGRNGPSLVINSQVDIGTKALAVTGNLSLYGAYPFVQLLIVNFILV
jgi:hypothetical protein